MFWAPVTLHSPFSQRELTSLCSSGRQDENEPTDNEDLLHDPRACTVHIAQGLAKLKGSSHTLGTHPQLQNVAFL